MTTNFRIFLAATVACGAITSMAPMAHAQSTGSIDFEEDIVITGSRLENGLAGVVLPFMPGWFIMPVSRKRLPRFRESSITMKSISP